MTMNTTAAPAGWHPDPSNPSGALRWWDGSAWTTHTHAAVASVQQPAATPQQPVATATHVAATQVAAWPGGTVTITPNQVSQSYGGGTYASAKLSFAQRNRHSLTAIGVVALYVLLAVTTHFVLLGIFPVLLSVRAIKAKETLAPAAVAAAVVAVLVAFAALH
jgi:Protein of unknown function (DUF2510)